LIAIYIFSITIKGKNLIIQVWRPPLRPEMGEFNTSKSARNSISNPHVYFSREIYQSLPTRHPIHLALFTQGIFLSAIKFPQSFGTVY
jgi:hypothetical protein